MATMEERGSGGRSARALDWRCGRSLSGAERISHERVSAVQLPAGAAKAGKGYRKQPKGAVFTRLAMTWWWYTTSSMQHSGRKRSVYYQVTQVNVQYNCKNVLFLYVCIVQ